MTRLFDNWLAEREDEALSYADPPRYRHYCTGPECGRCDDLAHASYCECDGTAECECGR